MKKNIAFLALLGVWFLIGRFSFPGFAVVALGTIALMWRKAMFLEILLGFFFILMLSDHLGWATDFAKTFKNIYIVLLAMIAFFERNRASFQPDLFKYFLPFIAVAIFGMFFSPEPFLSIQKWLSYFLILYTIPQMLAIVYTTHGEQTLKSMVFFGILAILIGFVLRFVDPGVAYSHGGRFRGMFGNPNGLGIFTLLLFAVAMIVRDTYGSLFSKGDLRWIFIPLVIAAVLSGSRTTLIAITLFYSFSFFYRLSPYLGFLLFIGSAIGAEIVASNIVILIQSAGLQDFFRVETLEDGSGRYIAWEFAWIHIQEYFWTGRGFAFDELLMRENQDFLNDLGHQGGVHNTYLIIWLNTGLLGLALFLRALILLFIKGSRNNHLAFPFLWMVLFSITLEPWLAASLNPFTIIFLTGLNVLSEAGFQPLSTGDPTQLQSSGNEAILA